MLAVWVLGGLISLCGALSVAELAASLPRTGGWYVYLREGWGRLAGFLFGWSELVLIRASATGAVATVFSEYLQRSLGYTPVPTRTNIIAAASHRVLGHRQHSWRAGRCRVHNGLDGGQVQRPDLSDAAGLPAGGPDASFVTRHGICRTGPTRSVRAGDRLRALCLRRLRRSRVRRGRGQGSAAHAATRHHRRHAGHHRDLSRGQPRLPVCESDRAAGAVAADAADTMQAVVGRSAWHSCRSSSPCPRSAR